MDLDLKKFILKIYDNAITKSTPETCQVIMKVLFVNVIAIINAASAESEEQCGR